MPSFVLFRTKLLSIFCDFHVVMQPRPQLSQNCLYIIAVQYTCRFVCHVCLYIVCIIIMFILRPLKILMFELTRLT